MRRDIELVRLILMEMENCPHGYVKRNPEIQGYSQEQIAYHAYLIVQAGFAEGLDCNRDMAPSPEAILLNLTWAGHDFISNSRSPTTWAQARELVSKVGDASISIWQSVLTDIVKRSLGI